MFIVGRLVSTATHIFVVCLVSLISDPNPKVEQIYHNVGDDKILRVQNFSILNRHLRSYYQVLN